MHVFKGLLKACAISNVRLLKKQKKVYMPYGIFCICVYKSSVYKCTNSLGPLLLAHTKCGLGWIYGPKFRGLGPELQRLLKVKQDLS